MVGRNITFSPPIFPAPRPTPYPTQKACKSKSFKVCAHPHGGFFLKEILVVNYKPTVGHKVCFFHYDHPGPRHHRARLPPPKPRHKNKENILIFFSGTTSGKKAPSCLKPHMGKLKIWGPRSQGACKIKHCVFLPLSFDQILVFGFILLSKNLDG